MSYYVISPTTNLSNILSSESISPAGLYKGRSSGFRSFDLFAEEKRIDAIRLYKERPAFRDDEPSLIIRIDERLVRECETDNDGRLWTADTIYLEPNSRVRFLFRSQEELTAAYSAVRKSIEAKFVDSYKSISSIPKDADNFAPAGLFDDLLLSGACNEAPISEPDFDIASFERIDRMKGAIFCFCLGESLSINDSDKALFVGYMQAVERMVNAIPSMPPERLESIKADLERILFLFSCREKVDELAASPEGEQFDLDEAMRTVRAKSQVELPAEVSTSTALLGQYRSDLESRLYAFGDISSKSRRARPKYEAGELILPKAALATALVNAMVQNNFFQSAGRTLRYPFARKCGEAVKAFVGGSWQESEERAFINSLLLYLNEGQPMDSASIDTLDDQTAIALRSMARLCMRDENKDLDSFYRFLLIKCGVSDFAVPFAMWGATFGFSSIPKTLCDLMDEKAVGTSRDLFKKALKSDQ